MTIKKVKLKRKASDKVYSWFFEDCKNFWFIKAFWDDFEKDVFVTKSNSLKAKTWDEVEFIVVKPAGWDKKAEWKIVKILEKLDYEGEFDSFWDYWFVKPFDRKFNGDFFVAGTNSKDAESWDIVAFMPLVKKSGKKPEAKVLKILKSGAPKKEENFTWQTVEWILNITKTGHFFVDIEGEEKGYYVFSKNKLNALPWDKVKASVKNFKWRDEASVIKVLERWNKPIVGEYVDCWNYWFVLAENEVWADIFVTASDSKKAVNWEKVWVVIKEWKLGDKNPRWRVVKNFWSKYKPGADIDSLVFEFGVKTDFRDSLLASIKDLPENPSEEEFSGRKDLRDDFIVTIDWADARDLDDAISIEKLPAGYKLFVHIADVANYVTEKAPLDKEAFERWTSVYLPDRVIPMLPQKLSNGLCSLNPHVPRLALTCEMTLNENGEFESYKTYESVIKVNHRLTYDFVRDILTDKVEEGDFEYKEKNGYTLSWTESDFKELKERLSLMEELRVIVAKHKEKLWVLDFEFPESKIILDENLKAKDIVSYDRHFAHKMIEEFMILANEAISREFSDIPFLYRVHPKPLDDSIDKLRWILSIFGYTLPVWDITPKKVSKLIKEVSTSPNADMLNKMILRSLTKALYSDKNEGHFGLALGYYSHFTSPIRRYPDLQIHRIIKEKINGEYSPEREKHYAGILSNVWDETSEKEVNAEKLEYAVKDMKKCEYMEDKIGQIFEGTVSSIIPKGFWVELPNTVEGFVSVNSLPDFYDFEELTYSLVSKTKKVIKIWDKMKVKLVSVEKENKRIDFEIVT